MLFLVQGNCRANTKKVLINPISTSSGKLDAFWWQEVKLIGFGVENLDSVPG